MVVRGIIAGLLCILAWVVEAQEQRWWYSGQVGGGWLIPHTEKLAFETNDWVRSLQLRALWQTSGRQPWAEYHRYPRVGINLRVQNFGNQAVLGHAVSAFPSIEIPLIRRDAQLYWFHMGTGISHLSRTYDRQDNAANTAIGSSWNNVTALAVGWRGKIAPGRQLAFSVAFHHHSNGGMRMPNLGLNTIELSGAFEWAAPAKQSSPEVREDASWDMDNWSFFAEGGMAWTQHVTVGGPTFPVFSGRGAVSRMVSPVCRMHLGFEWERNHERIHFYRGLLRDQSRSEAKRLGTMQMVFVASEFLFGPVSVAVAAGVYASETDRRFPVYNQLWARYYVLNEKKPSGIYFFAILKSHLATAEYLGLGIGYQL